MTGLCDECFNLLRSRNDLRFTYLQCILLLILKWVGFALLSTAHVFVFNKLLTGAPTCVLNSQSFEYIYGTAITNNELSWLYNQHLKLTCRHVLTTEKIYKNFFAVSQRMTQQQQSCAQLILMSESLRTKFDKKQINHSQASCILWYYLPLLLTYAPY